MPEPVGPGSIATVRRVGQTTRGFSGSDGDLPALVGAPLEFSRSTPSSSRAPPARPLHEKPCEPCARAACPRPEIRLSGAS